MFQRVSLCQKLHTCDSIQCLRGLLTAFLCHLFCFLFLSHRRRRPPPCAHFVFVRSSVSHVAVFQQHNISFRKKHFCGVVAEAFESRSNILYIRFFATQSGMESEFSLLYTAFTKKKPLDGKNNSTLACGVDEFDCDDDTCIDGSLVCDHQPNCKFKKDEANCEVCNVI